MEITQNDYYSNTSCSMATFELRGKVGPRGTKFAFNWMADRSVDNVASGLGLYRHFVPGPNPTHSP